MKTKNKHRIFRFFGWILMICLSAGFLQAQEENDLDNYRMLFDFTTVKMADQSRQLQVEFLARNRKDKKDKIPVVAAPIEFYSVSPDDEILLGKADTDNFGMATFVVPAAQEYFADEEGFMTLVARFAGSDVLDSEEAELLVKDLLLEMDLVVEDSIPMVYVHAFTVDSTGEKFPVEELEFILSVEGMFSKLPLEEAVLEEGTYSFEMPSDLPGDSEGNIIVCAVVEDHEEFMNVTMKKTIDWGAFKKEPVIEKNKLWTEAAPGWMYIVLTILLVGVWANYAYTLRNLFRIRKLGKD